jgi:ABC-type spermidine/putrescine transport system permease subunit II
LVDENMSDTGQQRAFDEKNRIQGARAFDTLVESNLRLVASIRFSMLVMIAAVVLAAIMTVCSAYILHTGQEETRSLLLAISQRPRLCTEVIKEVSK